MSCRNHPEGANWIHSTGQTTQHTLSISIIVPTINRPARVERLLRVLESQFAVLPNGSEGEIVIVNDASDSQQLSELKCIENTSASGTVPVHWVHREVNGGPGAARNSGIAVASGEVLVFLDDDCIPQDGCLARILQLHRIHPGILVLNGKLRPSRNDLLSRYWHHQYLSAFCCNQDEPYPIHRLAGGHFSIKRALLGVLSPLFDEELCSNEDLDLYLRLEDVDIPVYKADSAIATTDCQESLSALLRQRRWYAKGRGQIEHKYGRSRIEAESRRHRAPPRFEFGIIHTLLFAQRWYYRLGAAWNNRVEGNKSGMSSCSEDVSLNVQASPGAPVPELSIVVLTYNRASLLDDCLHTLLRQNQPADRFEVIVADDGSTDDTLDVVLRQRKSNPALRYVHHSHCGIPATRNLGIRAARAPLVAIVADDYLFESDYADTIFHFFDEYADAGVVRFAIVASRSNFSSRLSDLYFQISVMNRLHLDAEAAGAESQITTDHSLEAAGAAAFRRDALIQCGMFDENLQRAEDTDYTRRLQALGILIYYNPFHEVRHQYRVGCFDTMKKSFVSGYHRYWLHRKYAGGATFPHSPGEALRGFGLQVSRAWRHAGHIESRWSLVFYIPGLLLFETLVKAGLAWGLLSALLGKNILRQS